MQYKRVPQKEDAFAAIKYLVILLVLRDLVIGQVVRGPFLLVIGALLTMVILGDLYRHFVWKTLRFEWVETDVRLYQGQQESLRFRIRQEGWLPLFNAQLILTAGKNIEFLEQPEYVPKHVTQTQVRFSLGGHRERLIEVPFVSQHRGTSRLIQQELEVSPIFGFQPLKLALQGDSKLRVLIYPDRFATNHQALRDTLKPGDFMRPVSLFHDGTQVMGQREYVQGDSPKTIHWKLSARKGELMTKQAQPVTKMVVHLFLNMRSTDSFQAPVNLEALIERVAYLTGVFVREGIPYQIVTNMQPKQLTNQFYQLPQGSGKAHYRHTLEVLANLQVIGQTVPFERFLTTVVKTQALPTQLIITGETTPAIDQALRLYTTQGVQVYQLTDAGLHPYVPHLEKAAHEASAAHEAPIEAEGRKAQ